MNIDNGGILKSKHGIPSDADGLHQKLPESTDDASSNTQYNLGQSENNKSPTNLTDVERKFLLAVERGDTPSAKAMLDNQTKLCLNVNCADSLDRNALNIAIENEHLEMLEILLEYNTEIGDSLLHAISEESVEAVDIILKAMNKRPKKKDLLGLLGNSSSVYTPDITPLILAAHKDNYPIIKILLDRGDSIPRPHDLRCSCHECVTSHKEDSLRHSRSRINAYRALASPSLICLSSIDPILTAFELCWELKRLGKLENEFKEDYENLSLQCQQFATNLISQTRGSSELMTILNHDSTHSVKTSLVPDNNELNSEEIMTLSRLKLAIKYKQKSFIAHPHCQQLLASLWYEGLPGIRKLSFINQSAVIGLICSLFPVLSTAYLISPNSRIGTLLKKPFIKFLCHQSSFLLFLLLITGSSMKIDFVIFGGYADRINDRGPPPSILEWPIIIYLAGLVWKEVKKLYSNDLKTYVANMWNLLDFGTNALYVATLTLRIAAYIKVYNDKTRSVYRGQWNSYEPVLISECLFAGANIISTLKVVFMFTISPTLGPLQISLGRMLGDILNFFSLYLLVLVAYAIGFHEVFWFYSYERMAVCDKMEYTYQSTGQDLERYQYCTTRGRYFTNIFEIVQALYWSIYGLIDVTNLNLEHEHKFTEFIGKLMFGSFCYITIIMLLNMFIAMMNNSYQIISEKSDMEWKFARSKLWISYFQEGGTVPVPFNIIPSLKSCFYFYIILKQFFCGCTESQTRSKWKSIRKLASEVKKEEIHHQLVINDLVKRYLINRQKDEEGKGVTEDDLNEIKGDISSFRFELLEILQMNGMNIPVYVNSKRAGRLRKKGSKKGFHRVAHRLQKEVSITTRKFAKSDHQESESHPITNFDKQQSFDNQGFKIEDELHVFKSTVRVHTIKEEEETSRRQSTNSVYQAAQPLNASNLLQESTSTITDKGTDGSLTIEIDDQESGGMRSDMV